ncbi:type VI secretion protein ImpA [Serratia oryzae]|uniref:Type VI secretion protein ImpA n=1 Tax=Serratia oryzae TaxID=2034155 RepID=A0A1S8CH84_9GAMM|nr:type VI secretion protein ImpA [Serratia oryzae]OMQ21476.1 type VI secretion protein ImpA [Serratia oryzae]
MAILHPLECYLLELYSSVEHYAATRDAIIAWVEAHEAAYVRLQNELPVRIREEPQWRQGDMVWGSRVLPNIRPDKDRYINAYILRTQNDPKAFKIGHTMSNNTRGIVEFWDGWMTEQEQERIDRTERLASSLDKKLTATIDGSWDEGHLTYLGQSSIYELAELPKRIPRYELDHNVRIEKDEKPQQIGIYLPDVEFAAARLLYPGADFDKPPTAMQGTKRSEWVSEKTGERAYNWHDFTYAETGWTLIRRVEGEYIDVPAEGFFPKGEPDELYTWSEREKHFISGDSEYLTVWAGEPAPHAGEWSIYTQQGMQYVTVNQGQSLPHWTDKHGLSNRVQWTLIKRADGGSVYK